MRSDSLRRTAFLVSLIAVLATPCASAAGGVRPVQVESASPGLLDRVLSLFRIAGNRAPHPKEGCKLDPDGRCYIGVTQPPSTKSGCKIDPDGYCLP